MSAAPKLRPVPSMAVDRNYALEDAAALLRVVLAAQDGASAEDLRSATAVAHQLLEAAMAPVAP